MKGVCIPDGGHTVHLTHPKEVNQAVLDFVSALETPLKR
jgi:pimeloyl-ACP methyl ester carboxylesterase